MRELYNPDDMVRFGSDSRYGWSVAGLGDLNGDTLDDIAISANDSGSPGFAARLAPVVRVYSGTSIGPSLDETWQLRSFQSTSYNDTFGINMCGIGG